jgi:hypothetical protein
VTLSTTETMAWQVEEGLTSLATSAMPTISQIHSSFSILTSYRNKYGHANSILPPTRHSEDQATHRLGGERDPLPRYATSQPPNKSLTLLTESISDHMYRMSMLALFAPPSLSSRLDIVKVTKMCLFHDKSAHF